MGLWKRPEKHVRVGPAKHGQGVFATKRLRAKKILGEIAGDIIDDAAYGSDYCMDLGGTLSLEPEPPFRFVNHCCDPNCTLLLEEGYENESGKFVYPKMFVQTLRRIESGEQLTIDYAWPVDSAIPCGCDSPRCRGWIVAEKELPKIVESRPVAG